VEEGCGGGDGDLDGWSGDGGAVAVAVVVAAAIDSSPSLASCLLLCGGCCHRLESFIGFLFTAAGIRGET